VRTHKGTSQRPSASPRGEQKRAVPLPAHQPRARLVFRPSSNGNPALIVGSRRSATDCDLTLKVAERLQQEPTAYSVYQDHGRSQRVISNGPAIEFFQLLSSQRKRSDGVRSASARLFSSRPAQGFSYGPLHVFNRASLPPGLLGWRVPLLECAEVVGACCWSRPRRPVAVRPPRGVVASLRRPARD
jgi:hypothetical protein